MSYKILILDSAEQDLFELRNYIIKNFSANVWRKTFDKIKNAIRHLKTFPKAGSIPEELEQFDLSQFRQIVSEMNRIIYEIREKTIYIHIIMDVRKDMSTYVTSRLLRAVSI